MPLICSTIFDMARAAGNYRSPFAGLFSTLPSLEKREPWHGQSHECSAVFHFSAHPICGQTLLDGVSNFFHPKRQNAHRRPKPTMGVM